MTADVALGFEYLAWLLYLAMFPRVVVRAVRFRTPAHVDMALFFGSTALLSASGVATALAGSTGPAWFSLGTSILIMALPYLLLRLVSHFAEVSQLLRRAVELGLVVACIAVIVYGSAPPHGITLLLVAYFVAVLAFDTRAFLGEASVAHGVTRRRYYAIAVGCICVGVVIVLAYLCAILPALSNVWLLLTAVAALLSGLAYATGFVPPVWLRRAWQEPELRLFLHRSRDLAAEPDIRRVAHVLEDAAADAVGASAGLGIWLEQEGVLRFFPRQALPVEAGEGFTMDVDSQVFELRPGVMIAGKAFAEQQPVFSLHAARDDPRYAAYYRAVGSTALYAAPVSTAGRRLGVLVVYSPRPPIFGQSDLELVQLLADQAAFVLENRILIEETAAARARADANRLKDEFLSGISHDLRNPLTALHGLVQVLERRLDQTGHVDPDRLHSALALIRASSAQMSGLVDQLVDYGRVRMDQPLDLNLRPTDLVILARRTIEAYATTSDRHTVRLEAGSERLEGRWDARRLERVLQNLLSNAFKYSPAGGEITVRIDLEPSEGRLWARLQVQDRGIGIPEADLPFVFDRFHRASNSRGAVPGTGIGLATVQQIVVQHDGTISVSSQMGAGTTVTVRLPAATQITRGTAPEPGLA